MSRPFRFWAGGGGPDVDLRERAREAEALGYDALVFSDHLLGQPSPIPAMAAAAAVTTTLRVGAFVLNNDLRHPAVLAHELATIDRVSGGRVIVGVGAGWNKPEYDAAGIAYDPIGRRISRLAEAITILKGAFAGGVDLEGEHYRVHGLGELPKPIQQPHPPFLVGGGGRRILSLAATEAQIVGLAPRAGATGGADISSITAAATDEKLEWIRTAAGDRFANLDINTYSAIRGGAQVIDNPQDALAAIAATIRERFGVEMGEAELRESPHVLVGSVGELAEKLAAMRERWAISTVLVGEDLRSFAPLVARLAGT